MKKFTSLLTVAIIALIGMVAQAKTITITINDPEGATVINTNTSETITWDGARAENVEIDNDASKFFYISTARNYSIADVQVDNVSIGAPTQVYFNQIPDGGTLAIFVTKGGSGDTGTKKSVTFTIDNPNAATIYDSSAYYTYSFDGKTSFSLQLESYTSVTINASQGYQLETISINGTPLSYVDASSTTIQSSQLTNGATVSITTKEKAASVFYVIGDPNRMSFSVDYSTTYNASNIVDGKWTITTTNTSSFMSITTATNYVISSITRTTPGGDAMEILSSYEKYKNYANIYFGSFPSGTTITVTCTTLEEARTGHCSIEVVDGTPDQIMVYCGSNSISPDNFSNIAYIPGIEDPQISGVSGNTLYKVTVNGQVQPAPQYGSYYLGNLPENAEIKVWPNFPDTNVPVNITFSDESIKGVVSSVSVNGTIVEADEWQADDFTVKLGARFGMSFNTQDYTISSVTMNGSYQSPYGFETTITSDDAINIHVIAEKLKGYNVTVYYEPGTIEIYRDYSKTNPVELPEDEDQVTIEVSPYSSLYFFAAEGYLIDEIEDANGNKYPYGSVSVYSDMELTVTTNRFVRDQELVVYLQSGIMWNGSQIVLAPNNYLISQYITLNSGYNFIQYSPVDTPFNFYIYADASIYLNGEKIESVYGGWPQTENLASGSVVKVFSSGVSVENYNLTITKAEGVDVDILADYVTPIEGTSATVFGPTDVEFIAKSRAATLPFIVKVNGTEIVPTEEGRVIAQINSDSTIAIEANTSSSIAEINAEGNDDAIYNLQGVRVSNPQKGIFIKNGKKIIL